MGNHSIHTNIALDYPTIWTGSIYSKSNIKELFESDNFVEKVLNEQVVGTIGFKEIKKLPSNLISHVVTDAYISDDNEIMFDIKTSDGQLGKKLDIMLEQNPSSYLAKIVATVDLDQCKDGVVNLIDVRYVHIDEK